MSRAAIVISLVAMFLIGATLGLVGGIVFTHHFAGHLHGLFAGPGPGFGPGGRAGGPPPLHDALPRLQKLLDLTPAQVKRIEPRIVESRQQFEAARESLRSRIDAELTPAQRERWRAFHRDHPFPGAPRGDDGRDHRPRPEDGGEPR